MTRHTDAGHINGYDPACEACNEPYRPPSGCNCHLDIPNMATAHLVPCCTTWQPPIIHNDLFHTWHDAYHQALFRAAVTGRRYQVWYEPQNKWWNIRELHTTHWTTTTP